MKTLVIRSDLDVECLGFMVLIQGVGFYVLGFVVLEGKKLKPDEGI